MTNSNFEKSNATALVRIRMVYSELGNNGTKIADYILNDPAKASKSSISAVARDLNVADSTIYEFARKLGFTGYKEFKNSLLREISETDDHGIAPGINEGDSAYEIACKVFDSDLVIIQDTRTLIDGKAYEEAAKSMLNAGVVAFFGIGGSNTTAYVAYHRFLRTPVRCHFDMEYNTQLMTASLLSPNDCGLVFSHAGSNSQMIRIAKMIRQRGAKLIVITGHPLSEVAKQADITLLATSKELLYQSESLVSRIPTIAVIDALYEIIQNMNPEATKENISKIEEALEEHAK